MDRVKLTGVATIAMAALWGAATLPSLASSHATASSVAPGQRVNLCGWIHNPTPANWWLTDSLGQWVLGTQGSEQVPGMDKIPDLSEKQWVATNGSYGYGCGCMNATVDRKNKRVLQVHSFKQKPLAVCRADRKLPKPGD